MNRKLKISLYLAAIFVAGIVTGMFISYQVARHMMPSREGIASHWCGELQSKLNLTPQQMEKIRPIVDDALNDFRRNLTHEMLASVSNCNARVAVGLTPAQKASLEQFQREQEGFIRAEFGGEGSHPGK